MTDAHKAVVTIAIPRRLVPDLLEWIDYEVARCGSFEPAYRADLQEARAAICAAVRGQKL